MEESGDLHCNQGYKQRFCYYLGLGAQQPKIDLQPRIYKRGLTENPFTKSPLEDLGVKDWSDSPSKH